MAFAKLEYQGIYYTPLNATTTMSDVDQEYVILESNDGFQFVLRKSAAKVSKAIRSMLDKKSMHPFHYLNPTFNLPSIHYNH